MRLHPRLIPFANDCWEYGFAPHDAVVMLIQNFGPINPRVLFELVNLCDIEFFSWCGTPEYMHLGTQHPKYENDMPVPF